MAPGAMVACGLDVSGLAGSEVDASDATAVDTGIDTGLFDTNPIDTGTPDTGGNDTGVPDSGDSGIADTGTPETGCTGVICNGSCTTAGDCRSCSGAPLLCGSTNQCVAGCQACTDPGGIALPIECFACDISGQNPIGTCQYDDAGTYCLSGDYAGQHEGGTGYQCACEDADVSTCPGATQVCVPLGTLGHSFCLTCGEPTTGPIDGKPCRDGGTCQEGQALCQ
jgi:hypothetical protein